MRLWRKPLDADRIPRIRGEVRVQAAWCKGCRYCIYWCPRDVLELSPEFNGKGYHFPVVKHPEACMDCKLCERLCPEYAIVALTVESGPSGPQRHHAPENGEAVAAAGCCAASEREGASA